MKQKELDLSVEVTFKDGRVETFENPILAAEATGLSEASIKVRCSREGAGKDGIHCKWANENTRRSKQAKKSKNKGHAYERQIINELTAMGYEGLKSSRSESKNLDNAKIDIADTEDVLSCYIQCKATKNIPSVVKINNECPIKDKPLAIFWKVQDTTKNKQDEFVIIPKSYFYELFTRTNTNP